MDETRKMFRVFDAFPKTPPSKEVRSYRGSYSSILTYFLLIFLIWVQVGGFIDGFVDHQFSVDEIIRKDLKLNIDIIVKMPCKYLEANVRDVTEDRFLASELLNFDGMSDNIPQWYFNKVKQVVTPELDDVLAGSLEAEFFGKGHRLNEDLPSCRILGSLPINRVQGDFHITAKGRGYLSNAGTPEDDLNFTHYINEFSFGKFYPYLDNPLDMTYQLTKEKKHTFHYSLNVVPTVFKKLGHEVDTNQYSMKMFETSNKYAPGIFFKYDFEPIKMTVVERRLPFFQFVIKLVTIIGGVWVIAQWAYKVFEKLIILTLGKEVARRGEEKKGGLLDEEEDDFETI